MKKRVLSILLCCLLCTGCLAQQFSASAADAIPSVIFGTYIGTYSPENQGVTGLTFTVCKTQELLSDNQKLSLFAQQATNSCLDENGQPKKVFTAEDIRAILEKETEPNIAMFYYYPVKENPDVESGLYYTSVSYNAETKMYDFKGLQWIQHDTYLFAGLHNCTLDMYTLSGDVYSDSTSWFWTNYVKVGEFSLERQKGTGESGSDIQLFFSSLWTHLKTFFASNQSLFKNILAWLQKLLDLFLNFFMKLGSILVEYGQ